MNTGVQMPQRTRAVLIGALLVAAVLVAGLVLRRQKAPAYYTATVTRGNLSSTVDATGTINAVTTVQVGSQVSGIISRILVNFNSHVRQGQLIAEIDPTVYQGQVLQARADLANAQASFKAAQAAVHAAAQDINVARANEEKASAALEQSRLDLQRTTPLFRQGIVAAQQFDQVQATYRSNLAAYHAAQSSTRQVQSKLKTAEAQQVQAQAGVQQKRAALSVAETNLAHCRIYSPIDGTVINRAVDVGQTVAASFQTPTLFTIAQDLGKMQVYVATDESDVGRIRVGDKATFTVDAFPHQTFHGAVTQIRMNATTVQNVVQYNTVIDFENPGRRLFPGMTAYVQIPVETALNVLTVPNAALRFTPEMKPEELSELYKQYGIPEEKEARQRAAPRPAAATPAQPQPRSGGAAGSPGAGAAPPAAAPRPQAAMRPENVVVWKLVGKSQLVPVRIRTGITDFTQTAVTEVLQGELKAGDRVVTGVEVTKNPATATPFGGRPPIR